MKHLLAGTAACIVIGFSSCKEIPPDIGLNAPNAVDTTYVDPAPETPQSRRVLMEEFTGASCPPCPGGHAMIASLETQHPDNFIAVGYSPFGMPQTEPVHNVSKEDFRLQEATNLKDVFGVGAIPTAVIDRMPGGSGYPQDVPAWSAAVNNRIAVATRVNLHMTSVYNAAAREANVEVKARYTAAVAKKQVLTLVLLENNIIDAQKNGLNIDTNYTHKHVLRKMYTPYSGSPVLDSMATKGIGRVYARRFKISIPQGWNPDNCKLVAWISNNEPGDKEVQQSEEINLK